MAFFEICIDRHYPIMTFILRTDSENHLFDINHEHKRKEFEERYIWNGIESINAIKRYAVEINFAMPK